MSNAPPQTPSVPAGRLSKLNHSRTPPSPSKAPCRPATSSSTTHTTPPPAIQIAGAGASGTTSMTWPFCLDCRVALRSPNPSSFLLLLQMNEDEASAMAREPRMTFERPKRGFTKYGPDIDQTTKLCPERWKQCVEEIIVIEPALTQVRVAACCCAPLSFRR